MSKKSFVDILFNTLWGEVQQFFTLNSLFLFYSVFQTKYIHAYVYTFIYSYYYILYYI